MGERKPHLQDGLRVQPDGRAPDVHWFREWAVHLQLGDELRELRTVRKQLRRVQQYSGRAGEHLPDGCVPAGNVDLGTGAALPPAGRSEWSFGGSLRNPGNSAAGYRLVHTGQLESHAHPHSELRSPLGRTEGARSHNAAIS